MVIRIIACLGAFLLSTAPISQAFAQVKQQQEAQAAVEDTLSNSSTSENDNLQLLRPDATTIFPKADSIPVADSVASVPAAPISTVGWVGIGVLIAYIILTVIVAIACSSSSVC